MQSRIQKISKKQSFSSTYYGGSGRKSYLITYPQCEIDKRELMKLLHEHRKFNGNIQYIIVCNEKHRDGNLHSHIYIEFKEAVTITREQLGSEFDLIREWEITKEGEERDIIDNWDWAYKYIIEINEIRNLKGNTTYIQKTDGLWEEISEETIEQMRKEGKGGALIKKYHGMFRGVTTKKGAIKYVKKDGNYISDGVPTVTDSLTREEQNRLLREKDLIQMVKDGDISIFNFERLKKMRDAIEAEERRRNIKPFEEKIVCYNIIKE